MSEEKQATEAPKAPETPQGGESPELKGILRDLQAERAKRQELEQALAEKAKADEEAKRKRMEEEGKLAELNAELKAKVQEYEPIVKTWSDYQEKRKAEILESLGDDADDVRDWSLSQLEVFASKVKKQEQQAPRDPGRPGESGGGYAGMSYADLGQAVARGDTKAREELARRNREAGPRR